MKNVTLSLGALALIALTVGCDRTATGQVAAVVGSEEITLQEINAELATMQVPAGVDKQALQRQALQRIVERRLLAKAAKEDGIDKDQEYLIRSRQLNDALLVQLLGKRAERAVQVPNAAAIEKFINSHPEAFAGRTIYLADQIQFPIPTDVSVLKTLESDHTMDAVASHLKQLGIQFSRRSAELDSLQVDKTILAKILALPAGEPFIMPQNGSVTVAVITGKRSAPVAGAEAKALAAQGLRNQELGQAMEQRLKAVRGQTKVDYQAGFAPQQAKSTDK